MTCAWTGNADAVKLLLAHGADVNAKEVRRGQTALMWAIEQKHFEAARVLVGGGADIRVRSKSGFSPLLFASKLGDLPAVRMLLAAGANVNDGTPIQNRPAGRRAAPLPDDADPNVPDGM